ncbi:polysaccharide deacetylase family protein [Desulfosporosinus sp. PR]|uniref:polysaccharide deacetylase family protein n=1 Tax=Candidatus Desulfosporosinus nitrosoreducens TaxID=3401928 RepID=UPI0027EA0279|nr:polysaccharide deacetylase family protein [Desulfosporosinus sp. PR]MDQ7093437.1 polysaccharide deacetylase family protein [Desulfosporosinus sp. PR]
MPIYVLTRRKLILCLSLVIVLGGICYLTAYSLTTPSIVRAPGTYYMAHTREKVVALTFDDGPDPIDTPAVLDILKEKGVRATFFVLGQAAQENPDLLKRLAKEGHEIGNHSFNHDYRQQRLLTEINRTDQEVYAATGTHTYFYRPPGGFLTKWQLESIKKNGQVVALWSVDSKDWRNPGVNQIVKNVLDNVFPGAIILLHDGGFQRTQTVKSLAKIIDSLQRQGYRFVTLSELKTFDAGDSELK